MLLAGPAAERLADKARALLPRAAGVSAFDGKLFCRILAVDGRALRRTLIPLLAVLRDGLPLPRLWTI